MAAPSARSSDRGAGKLKLHAFVVMPNPYSLITVPEGLPLERTMQFIKELFQAGKLLGVRSPIWQKSFVDCRVRDATEAEKYRNYIHQNPARACLRRRYRVCLFLNES